MNVLHFHSNRCTDPSLHYQCITNSPDLFFLRQVAVLHLPILTVVVYTHQANICDILNDGDDAR